MTTSSPSRAARQSSRALFATTGARVLLAAAALLSFAGHAAPAAATATAQPTVLEGIVVTPQGACAASDFAARRAARRNAVVLDTVVVTPARSYTLAEWQARKAPTQLVLAPATAPATVAVAATAASRPTHHAASRSWVARLLRSTGLRRQPLRGVEALR